MATAAAPSVPGLLGAPGQWRGQQTSGSVWHWQGRYPASLLGGDRSGAVPSAGEAPEAVRVVSSSSSDETNHQQLKTKRTRSPSGVSRAGRGVRTSWSWGQGKEEPKSWKHTNEGEKKIKTKKKGKKEKKNKKRKPQRTSLSPAWVREAAAGKL